MYRTRNTLSGAEVPLRGLRPKGLKATERQKRLLKDYREFFSKAVENLRATNHSHSRLARVVAVCGRRSRDKSPVCGEIALAPL
jgi:hypothetical protein